MEGVHRSTSLTLCSLLRQSQRSTGAEQQLLLDFHQSERSPHARCVAVVPQSTHGITSPAQVLSMCWAERPKGWHLSRSHLAPICCFERLLLQL